jgi:hypothetical protein
LAGEPHGSGMTRDQILAVFLVALMLGSSLVYGLSFF